MTNLCVKADYLQLRFPVLYFAATNICIFWVTSRISVHGKQWVYVCVAGEVWFAHTRFVSNSKAAISNS